MTGRVLVFAALLCALPARGSDTPLEPAVREALTPIDAPPSKVLVDYAFRGSSAVDRLIALASDSALDAAVQIRAIRMLPQYCLMLSGGCAGTAVHDALVDLVQGYLTALRQTPAITLSAPDLLRLRAAVEALGATHSAMSSDVAVLTQDPRALLRHPSRDVRVTVVRALRSLRSCAAIEPLRMLMTSETNTRVQPAILSALQNLESPGACM